MRIFAFLVAAITLSLPALADTHELAGAETEPAPVVLPGHEIGIYRFGATFSSIETYSASACQSACRANDACYAWSYLVGAGSANARCELKRSGGQIERNPMATSGFSPSKERQRPVARKIKHAPKTIVKTRKMKVPAGTVVTSRPVPLGASPSVSYTQSVAKPEPHTPHTPPTPSAKSSLRSTDK